MFGIRVAVVAALIAAVSTAGWCVDDRHLPSQAQLMSWVRELCRTQHRRPGTPEDHRAERYLADAGRRRQVLSELGAVVPQEYTYTVVMRRVLDAFRAALGRPAEADKSPR